jgi:hypothetical protein
MTRFITVHANKKKYRRNKNSKNITSMNGKKVLRSCSQERDWASLKSGG